MYSLYQTIRPRLTQLHIQRLLMLMLIGWVVWAAVPVGAQQQRVGGNRPILMARASWDTGWFQAEIYRQLVQELGYDVARPRTYDPSNFYTALADGELDFWVNGWFPEHDGLLAEHAATIETVGTQVRGGALQGYMVDRAAAEMLNIVTLADFERQEVAAHFDRDGNGRADLIGCNQGWGCGETIEHHLTTYGLQTAIDHVQGDYGPLMVNTAERFAADEPIFFYTWTPNWTIGELVAGRDVVWVSVPFPSLPEAQAAAEPLTIVPNVSGCTESPCAMGFPPNDILAVANSDFMRLNRAIRALLEAIEIPLDDISAQNALLLAGEELQSDIERHANEWIAANRAAVDQWLATAVAAHDESLVAEIVVRDTNETIASLPKLRVVTRPLAPFVIYDVDSREYTGFSIELWQMIADEADLEYELYGVNTVARLLDEVERGAADVAAAGIGITEAREGSLDFSYPYFESGLQILVDDEAQGSGFIGLVRGIFSPQLLEVLGILLLCLLVAAHIMWFSERHINEDFAETYWPGIWEAFWWSAVTATTVGYGDKTPKTTIGRIVGVVWMFSGLFVLASFTASIATTFAVNEVNSHIAGPDDLDGKRVATIERSTAEEYLLGQRIRPVLFQHEDDAVAALIAEEIDAFVYDAPVLQHYVALDEDAAVHVVGDVFQKQQYGVALSQNPVLREAINRALLQLVESGEYESLYRDWFGEE